MATLRRWLVDGVVAVALAYVLKHYVFPLLQKLAENAMLGWVDDKIAQALGDDLQTALNWVIALGLATAIMWVYHLVQVRFFRSSPVVIHSIVNPQGEIRQNIISQIPRHLYAQGQAAKTALGTKVVVGWIIIIASVVGLIAGIGLVLANKSIAQRGTVANSEYVPPAWAQDTQIRQKLISFIRSNADEIRDSVYRVNQNMFVAYDTMQGNRPRPLHDLFQQLFSVTFQQSVRMLDASIDKPAVSPHDAHEAIGYLQTFMYQYGNWQNNILAFQLATRLPTTAAVTDSMIQLQRADERAFGSLRDLMAVDPSMPRVNEELLAYRNGFFARWSELQSQSTQQITNNPPATPKAPITAYEKEQRLRAVDEIYAVIATQLQPTYDEGRALIYEIYQKEAVDDRAEQRLSDYLNKVRAGFDNLKMLQKKYSYFADIVQAATTNKFSVVVATHEAGNLIPELAALRSKAPNDMHWFLLRDTTMLGAVSQIRDFEQYLKDTTAALQEKRAEIEKAEVSSGQ
jgi:hypothetical protein